MPSSLDDFPVLTAARVVCRECLSPCELPNVALRINAFLKVGSVWKACFLGSVKMMKLVVARDKVEWDTERLAYNAARYGHVDLLQWLSDFHADRCHWCYVLNGAAKYGNLSAVKWLHTHRQDGCTTRAMDRAARNGHLPVVQWLHANRSEGCTTAAMDKAALNGHLEVVKWLHVNRTEGCTTSAMNFAARKGHLDVVKWLHENRTEGCTTDAMTYAASSGHLDVVKWLHENRSEGCSEEANAFAAANGHLDVVQWLHANGYKGNIRDTVESATIHGHLRVIKWLLSTSDNEKEHESYIGVALEVAKKGYNNGVTQWLETQVKEDLATNKRHSVLLTNKGQKYLGFGCCFYRPDKLALGYLPKVSKNCNFNNKF